MSSKIKPDMHFERWTVIEKCPERYHGQVLWRCKCDCGTVRNVPAHSLTTGRSRSCGCIRAQRVSTMAEDRELGYKVHEREHIDGTYLSSISPGRKVNRNSKTGVRGVSPHPDGRFRAAIVLRRHQYDLGIFPTLEEARDARLKAEKELYAPILAENADLLRR